MKNEIWKDKLREMYFVDSSMHAEYEAFVENLLEEQKKELTDIAWGYVVKATREESGSKKELEELLTKHI